MIIQLSMYYLSFLPLWVSIIIIDWISIIRNDRCLWIERISIPVIVSGIIISSMIVYKWITKKEKQNRETYTVENAKEVKFITAEFLMSYVFPLFTFDFTQWDGILLFVLFFSAFCFLVCNHNYFCTNIALELCKYKVYECELKTGTQIISKQVVSRKELNGWTGKRIRTRKYNNDYHFEVGVE